MNRIFRRRIRGERGTSWPAYDVAYIFWHFREIARLFPGEKNVEALFNQTLNPVASKFTRDWFRYRLRGFLWDRVLIYKK